MVIFSILTIRRILLITGVILFYYCGFPMVNASPTSSSLSHSKLIISSFPSIQCIDNDMYYFKYKKRTCKEYISKKPSKRCHLVSEGKIARDFCRFTCNNCVCADVIKVSLKNGKRKKCSWVLQNQQKKCNMKTKWKSRVRDYCPESCNICPTKNPSIKPSVSPTTMPSPLLSGAPSQPPTGDVTKHPSENPSHLTTVPTFASSEEPSRTPSLKKMTEKPSKNISQFPTRTFTQAPSIREVNDHMRSIFKFWSAFRSPETGMYCDNIKFTNSKTCGNGYYSIASAGWGLISDVIFTELGLLTSSEGRARANQTMETGFYKWPKNPSGYYKHFASLGWRLESEWSTIDTAIFITGCRFAGRYFGGDLAVLAEEMFRAVNFQAACNPDGKPQMYTKVNDDGKMDESSRYLTPYNEYYIVGFLAAEWEKAYNPNSDQARKYFETYFGLDGKPVGAYGKPKTNNVYGHEILSDSGSLVSSFIPLFCRFATGSFKSNPYYQNMMVNWLAAERAYWRTDIYEEMYTWGKNVTGRVFGGGAGDCPRAAYCVLKIKATASGDHTWSAAIMAGFLGLDLTGDVHNELLEDIEWLYENDVCTYKKTFQDGTVSKVLWRCSVHPNHSDWKADRPTSVDFATMVFGYSSIFLPTDFWDKWLEKYS